MVCNMNHTDIAVLGAGPAGLACAAACSAAGMRVVLVAPDPDAAWTPTYGAWKAELDGLEDDAVMGSVAITWRSARVGLAEHGVTTLERSYARIDGDVLQAVLRDRCAGVHVRRGAVRAVVHAADGSTLTDAAGTFRATLVVDATGHEPRFVHRPGPPARRFQAAYGIRVEGDAPPGFVFMDWDHAHLAAADAGPATFLYAQPLADGQAFWEETSLASTPAVPFEVLKARLTLRLERAGVRVDRILSEERCLLPMDAPLPALDQRTVGFGAAAAFLHPASGYALVRTLATAGPLAAALASTLDQGPSTASRTAWATLWPADRVRTRRLHQFGLHSLAEMGPARTRAFFAAFFTLPPTSQAAFLADSLPPRRLATLMAALFIEAPPQVRWAMVTCGAAASGSLFRALAGA